ncbi:MAK10-like protein [Tanacetum coccineum]|uniref:MAK10-like protein n=1 Tax=Tanacetum coccineum TaxID=301880 RepID=A0ABQ4Z9D7_9ASTR
MFLNVDQLQKQLDKDEFQEDGSMTTFWVLNRQFYQFIDSRFSLDYDSQKTNKYFVEYTGIAVKHFKDTLLEHLGNVKKSIAERTQSSETESEVQNESIRSGNDTDVHDADIRPIYDEEPMAETHSTLMLQIGKGRACVYFNFPFGQASNWLERLPAGSISTWKDLTTRFLTQFFPPGRTAKLRNDILMFQQHQGESLSEAWTRFKDLLQKVPHHGIDLWLQVQIFYDHVIPATRRTIDQSADDFAKPVKAISLPQDVPSTSDHRIVKLENQVQCLMEAHRAPRSHVQVNKIASSCEICSGPNDTQYCMENHEQAFVEYASSRTDEAGGKWYTFKPEQNNLGDTYNSSWKSHPNLRLSKFEADFKQQQGEMTNKIDTFLKAINDRMTRALPSDTVKNPKLNVNSTSLVLSSLSYPIEDPQCSSHIHNSINAIKMCSKQTNKFQKDQPQVKTITVNENETPQGKGIKSPSNLLSPKYQSQSSLGEQYRNSSSPKRVHFINTITILSKEDEPGETGIVKPSTKDNDHDTIVKVEEESEGLEEEGKEEKDDPEYINTNPPSPPNPSNSIYHRKVRFRGGANEIAYKMPHKIEQYNSLSDLEKEHTKSVYFRNEEDKRRGVDYVMNKILGFYKECLELGPEYLTGLDDEGGVTLYLIRRSFGVLRSFIWTILG